MGIWLITTFENSNYAYCGLEPDKIYTFTTEEKARQWAKDEGFRITDDLQDDRCCWLSKSTLDSGNEEATVW